jgi:hypothetical protein
MPTSPYFLALAGLRVAVQFLFFGVLTWPVMLVALRIHEGAVVVAAAQAGDLPASKAKKGASPDGGGHEEYPQTSLGTLVDSILLGNQGTLATVLLWGVLGGVVAILVSVGTFVLLSAPWFATFFWLR